MSSPPTNVSQLFRREVAEQFAKMQHRITHCVNQLTEKQLWWRPHPSLNSVANLVLHLCGNVRQWIIHGIGGEADVRQRPSEFTQDGTRSKTELLSELDATVSRAKEVVQNVDDATLMADRRIQGFDTNGLGAILDSLTHFQGHAQEIISLTRQQLRDHYLFDWQPTSAEQGA